MGRARSSAGFWARWSFIALACAAAATLLDGILLQLRRDFFTGGFLSIDHVTGPVQAVAFVMASLITDFVVLGAIVLTTLWAGARARMQPKAAGLLAIIVALAPVVVADFVQYRLASYVGDAFDLGLMFDLSGRSPMEIVAVASDHLVPLAAWIGAGVVVALVVWRVWLRYGPRSPMGAPAAWPTSGTPSLLGAVSACLLLLVGGGVFSAVVRSSSDVLDNGLRRTPAGRLLGTAVIAATDVDDDGFGILGRPPDPALFDARVQPYASDVPGNGVDEDGIAGDLPAGGVRYEEVLPPLTAWPARPDVVLIVLESFRADAVGAEIAGKSVTPVLSELARHGVHVSQAYSHNGYTVQSRHHILSGSLAGFDVGTLVGDFARNGYQTAYFSAQDDSFGGGQGAAGLLAAEVSYDARTDRARRYTTFTTAGSLAVPHSVLMERIEQFLAARTTDRPLFLYVNFHDTHFPYHHARIEPLVSNVMVPQGGIAPDAAVAVREMYLNTAANVDAAIGRLLERVRRAVGREPGVVVVSDHGESLFDENFLGHGYALNDAQTRIPLIVANLPLTIEEPFGQVDLRGVFRRAFATPAAGAMPHVVRTPEKAVFQYLGAIERPAQIAFVSSMGRITYDIRDRKFQSRSGTWQSPERLNDTEREEFLALVHTWERMILAKRTAAARH